MVALTRLSAAVAAATSPDPFSNLIDYFETGLDAESGQTPLHLAAKYGSTQIVADLINSNAAPPINLDARDEQKLTALHLAARHGHAAVVALLVAARVRCQIKIY